MIFLSWIFYQIVIAELGKSVKKSYVRSTMMISDSNATDCDKPVENLIQFSRAHLNHVAGIQNEVPNVI